MKILLSALMIMVATVASPTQVSSPLAELLAKYVDDEGLVDYAGLKADRKGLDRVCSQFAEIDPTVLASLSEANRMTIWLNCYNAFVLKLVVDNYPIQPSMGKTQYPANSIRQIPGAWEHKKFRAFRRDVTLDEIEHQILRVKFQEPRIHMALVNASMSAPRLRHEPYDTEKLDAQLDDQAKVFFSDLRNFLIDREAKEVWASPIFEWFVDDFLPEATKENPRHIAQQKSLSAFAARYVSAEDARYLAEGDYVIKYYDYDWTLNEQPQ